MLFIIFIIIIITVIWNGVASGIDDTQTHMRSFFVWYNGDILLNAVNCK